VRNGSLSGSKRVKFNLKKNQYKEIVPFPNEYVEGYYFGKHFARVNDFFWKKKAEFELQSQMKGTFLRNEKIKRQNIKVEVKSEGRS
jgi:hypothetical protein